MYKWYLAIVGCILVADWNEAARRVGLKRSAFEEGVGRMYKTGNLMPTNRQVSPSVYTPVVMKLAFDLLHEGTSLMNFLDLFYKVREYGHLVEKGCVKRFRQAFKAWCLAQGTPLTVNSVGTVFYLPDSDIGCRLEYARYVLKLMQDTENPVNLDQLIFVDEVSLEECPHPKGELIHVYHA